MMRLLTVLIVCGVTLVTSGCRAWWTQTPSTTSVKVAKAYAFVPNYTKAPCWMQRKWSEHNSVHATNIKDKETVFKAPCDVKQPKPAVQRAPLPPAKPVS